MISTHPEASQSFILEEIDAVRRQGVRISVYGIRRPWNDALGDARFRQAFDETEYLLDSKFCVLRDNAIACLRHPRAYLSTVQYALRLGLQSHSRMLWQAFYVVEGISLALRL